MCWAAKTVQPTAVWKVASMVVRKVEMLAVWSVVRSARKKAVPLAPLTAAQMAADWVASSAGYSERPTAAYLVDNWAVS